MRDHFMRGESLRKFKFSRGGVELLSLELLGAPRNAKSFRSFLC